MRKNPNPKQQQRLLKKNAGVCCVCKERGLGVNFHHIDGNNSHTVDENLAVLCVKDHDAHHRPQAYTSLNHLELGAKYILKFKKSWEAFVAEATKPNPKVLAVINVFGNQAGIHAMKLVFQWQSGKIELVRMYHLLAGAVESWIDHAFNEIAWLSENIKIVIISDVFEPEYCPSCSSSLTTIIDENRAKKITSESWASDSVCSIYVNPTNPSLAIIISLKDKILCQGHLHLCGSFLHFACAKYNERLRVRRKPSVRTQATRIIQKIIAEWEPGQILIGTGNPDSPSPIANLRLPECWEKLENI